MRWFFTALCLALLSIPLSNEAVGTQTNFGRRNIKVLPEKQLELAQSNISTQIEQLVLEGIVALLNDDFVEAEVVARQAIDLDPNDAELHELLSAALLGQERYEEAEVAARQAIDLDPNDAGAYINLSVALSGQERYEEAEAAYQQAISIDPNVTLPE